MPACLPAPSCLLPPPRYVVSPITGELVPIGEMAEHMRISLIDPMSGEQTEARMAMIRDTTKGACVKGEGELGWGGLGLDGDERT